MAKDPREQQRTDAGRIGDRGTGKLDRRAPGEAPETAPRAGGSSGSAERPSDQEARRRLLAAREAAVAELQRLGLSPPPEDVAQRGSTETVLDVGDVSLASERQDLAFAQRERLAARITTLTAALERLQAGTSGRCRVCGEPIEAERLAAVPETDTCLACQRQVERGGAGKTAA